MKFARFVFLAVSEEAKNDHFYFFRSMYNVRVSSASADNPYLDLDYSGYVSQKPHPIIV